MTNKKKGPTRSTKLKDALNKADYSNEVLLGFHIANTAKLSKAFIDKSYAPAGVQAVEKYIQPAPLLDSCCKIIAPPADRLCVWPTI